MEDPNLSGSHNTGSDISPCDPQEGTQTSSDAPGDIPGCVAEAALTTSPPLLEGTDGNTGPAASVAISNANHNIDYHVASPYNWRAHRLPPTPPLTLIARQVHTKDVGTEGLQMMRDEIGQSKQALPADGTSGSRLWCASYASKTLKDWSPPDRSAAHPQNNLLRFMSQIIIRCLISDLCLWAESRSRSSELFVGLEDLINDVVVAFRPYHIVMSPLRAVTDELREVLGTCLARDATPEDIELYLPTIRQILTKVLQVGQPVYHPSQQTYVMKRRNVEIHPRTKNRIQVTSEVVFLDDGTTTLSYSQWADHHHIPVISEMHNCALSLLRNLESWGYLRTQICDAFIAIMDWQDWDDLRSLSKDLCALLLESLAEDAIPEHVSILLPDIQSIIQMPWKKLEETIMVATRSITTARSHHAGRGAPGTLAEDAIPEHASIPLPNTQSIPRNQKFKERNMSGSWRSSVSEGTTFQSSDHFSRTYGYRSVPVASGRHVHQVKGNERPRVKPRPPQILQTDDRAYISQPGQPTEEGDN